MNRIYRTIWSDTKQCYVVVPETAKTRCKSNAVKAVVAIAGAAIVSLVGGGADAYTVTNASATQAATSPNIVGPGTVIDTYSGAIVGGIGATAEVDTQGESNIAIGTSATTRAEDGIALGENAVAGINTSQQNSIAIGTKAQSELSDSISIGTESRTSANAGIAIGKDALSGLDNKVSNTIAIGVNTQAVADGSIVIGEYAKIQSATPGTLGVRSIAIGSNASVSPIRQFTATNSVTDTLAIGTNALASGSRSIVIGANASSLRDPDNNTFQTGVDNIVMGTEALSNWNRSIAIGPQARNNMTEAVAIGYDAETTGRTGKNSAAVAVGPHVKAMGSGSAALGNNTNAYGNFSVAVGTNSTAQSTNSVAIGRNTITRSSNATSIGESANVGQGASRATVIGYQSHAASTSGVALGDYAFSYSADSTSIGRQATTYGDHSVAIGGGRNTTGTAGSNTFATGSQSVSLGSTAKAMGTSSLAFGTNAIAGGDAPLAASVQQALATFQTEHNAYVRLQDAVIQSSNEHELAQTHMTKAATDVRIVLRDLTPSEQATLIAAGVDYATLRTTMDAVTPNGSAAEAKAALQAGLTEMQKIEAITNTSGGQINASLRFLVEKVKGALTALTEEQVTDALKTTAEQDLTNVQATYDAAKATLEGVYGVAKTNAVAMGTNANAQGKDSVAVGVGATAMQESSFAMGTGAESKSTNAVAIGRNATVETGSNDSVAIGYAAKVNANSNGATAIGNEAQATGKYAYASGFRARATVEGAVAVGNDARATASQTVAVGTQSRATNTSDVAFGPDAQATAGFGVAVGVQTRSTGQGAAAVGMAANAGGSMAAAFGPRATASAVGSTALGQGASATVERGVALGSLSLADVVAREGFNPANQTSGLSGVNNGVDDARLNSYAGLTNRVLTANTAAVSVGGATVDGIVTSRQITNVAAGTADHDAVNVAQLRSVNLKLAGNTNGETTAAMNDAQKASDATAVTKAKADVLLDSQTLSIVSSDTNLITTDATNNTVTIRPKTAMITVDSTTGAVTTPGTGLITAADAATAIQNAGWRGNATGNLKDNSTATATLVKPGRSVNYAAGDNLFVEQTIDTTNNTQTYTYSVNPELSKLTSITVGENGNDGVDGTIGVNGKDGSAVVINGKDGSIGLNGTDGANGLTIKGDQGPVGVDGTNGADGKDGMTRIVYETVDPTTDTKTTHVVATMNDGQKYGGDNYVAATATAEEQNVIAKKMNERLDIVGGADATKLTDNNIGVNAVDGKLEVKLAQNVNLTSAGSLTVGNTVANNTGVTVTNGTNRTAMTAGQTLHTNGSSQLWTMATGIINQNGNNRSVMSPTGMRTTDGTNQTFISPTGLGVRDGNNKQSNVTAETIRVGGDYANNATTGGVLIGRQTQANSANTNETGKYITGLDNKTWEPDNPTIVSGRAATEDQLKVISDRSNTVINNVLSLGGDDSSATAVQALSKANGLKFNILGGGDKDKVSDNNISVVAAGTDVTVKLVKELKDLTSAEFSDDNGGSTVINGGTTTITDDNDNTVVLNPDGVTITDNTGKTSTSTAGNTSYQNGNNVTNIGSAGTDITDGQKTVSTTADGTTMTDSDKQTTVKAGETVVKHGDQTVTTNGTIKIENGTGQPTTEVTNNGITITPSTGDASKSVSLTDAGLDNGGNKITNVASGTEDTDGVNVSQLNQAINDMKSAERHIKPDTYTVANDGTVTLTYVDGNGNDVDGEAKITGIAKSDLSNITDDGKKAITNLGTVVKAGDNVTITEETDATTGQKTYTVNANVDVNGSIDRGTVTNSTDGKAVGPVTDTLTNNVTTAHEAVNNAQTAVDANPTDPAAQQALETAQNNLKAAQDAVTKANNQVATSQNVSDAINNSGWTANATASGTGKVDGTATGTLVKPGTVVNYEAGDNMIIKQTLDAATNTQTYTYSVNPELTGMKSITGGNNNSTTINIGDDGKATVTTKDADGKDAGTPVVINGKDGEITITKPADPTNNQDEKTITINTDGTVVTEGDKKTDVKAGETIVKDGDKTVTTKDGKVTIENGNGEPKTEVSNNGITITPSTGDADKTVSLTDGGLDNGGNKITNVTNGTADTDAVNVSQLKNAYNVVGSGAATVTSTGDAANGGKTFTVHVDPSAIAGTTNLGYKANGENPQTTTLTDGLDFTNGVNTVATVDAGGKVTFDLAKNLKDIEMITISKDGGTTTINGGTTTSTGKDGSSTTINGGNTVVNDGKGNTTTINGGGITINPNGNTDPNNQISITHDGINAGGKTITNVAPGVNDTDAVNVSQLNSMKGDIDTRIGDVDSRLNRVGSQAAALGALKTVAYDPLEPTQIMAGYGYYKGESSLALGVAHYKNESVMFHAGAAIGGRSNEVMANAGVTWKVGSRADETAVKDTFRQGPISSSYTLQDKVSALEVQNKAQKDEISALRDENAEIKAQLAEVLRRLNA